MSQANPKVFICYRREDTAAHAGRLYDAMVARFGERNVFMDVDLAPGVDFVERITEVVSSCQVLIVVMGPNWATVEDEDGERRICDPDDFVRLEVETALRRPEVTPIPALVSEARMPKREELPAELQPLTRRNALELSDSRWTYDVERLHNTLDELLTGLTRPRETVAPAPTPPTTTPMPQPQPAQSSRPPTPTRSGLRLILEGAAVAAMVAYAGRWLVNPIPSPDNDALTIASVLLRRGGTWALTAAALAVWLSIRTGRTKLVRLGVVGLLVGALAGIVGGAIWAVPSILPDPNLDKVDLAAANRIQIGSLAVTGGILGALIGWLWGQNRLGAGLLGGAAAGIVAQLFLNAAALASGPTGETGTKALAFGIAAAAIAGLSLTAMTALDARQAGAPARVPARAP